MDLIFILAKSKINGIGVYSTTKIKKGTFLPLFEKDDYKFVSNRIIKKAGILKKIIKKYAVEDVNGYHVPLNFNRMSIGWYLNHSDDPNAFHDAKYNYYALKNIKAKEEITIDYKKL